MADTLTENNSCLICADYLEPGINARLYAHAIAKQADFEHTQTVGLNGEGALNVNYRHSLSLRPKDFIDYYRILKRKIKEELPQIVEKLSIEPFEPGNVEMHLTSHNHGEFYKPHIDNGQGKLKHRVITFVYYFHSIPKQFEGGQLLFLKNKPKPLIVQPDNNSIVFFNSSFLHAVHPVTCPSQKFEDGRFTLNGWIWKKVDEEPIAEKPEQPATEQ
jgi:Rps23 Pro-64 3,4-dihydroxylase Tpa1-like proline 4-hydroxylase